MNTLELRAARERCLQPVAYLLLCIALSAIGGRGGGVTVGVPLLTQARGGCVAAWVGRLQDEKLAAGSEAACAPAKTRRVGVLQARADVTRAAIVWAVCPEVV